MTFRVLGVLCVVVSSSSFAAAVCESPRIRDTGPLATAIAQDRTIAQSFQKTAQDCAAPGDVCDKARADCGSLLATTLKAQVEFDEGWWLRDIMLVYLGTSYPMSRPIVIGQPLTDVSCGVEVQQLNGASVRRLQQAERRQAILNEYPKYARWANEAYQRCKEQAVIDEQRANQTKAEAERIAAAAVAAKVAEDARRTAEEDKRKKAETEAKRMREAQEEQVRQQREAQVEAERKQKDAAEKAVKEAKEREDQAKRQAQDEAEKRADAEKQAKKEAERAQRDAEDKARREKEDAEQQARVAEETRIVKEREARKEALRAQRAALVAEAETAAMNESEEAKERRKAALLSIDAEEEKIKEQNERRIEEAKKKAAAIAIPEEDERSRGAVGITGGAGYGGVGGTTGGQGNFAGAFAGGQLLAHLGIWGVAPAAGMANGFEIRLALQYSQAVGAAGTNAARSIEGHVAGRYFFGPLGLGVAGEFRVFDSTVTPGGARSSQFFEVGPAIGVSMVDNPHVRASLNVQWLPVGTAIDVMRGVGDLEVSYELFTFDLLGGTLSDPTNPGRFGFFAMATVGVRLRW